MMALANVADPTTATFSWHEPAFVPVTAYPPAVERTVHVSDGVLTRTSRPWEDLPPGAAIVNDLPTFTDVATEGSDGLARATVVAGDVPLEPPDVCPTVVGEDDTDPDDEDDPPTVTAVCTTRSHDVWPLSV